MIDAPAPTVETQVRARRWLWSVLPRYEETLQPEFWRFTGKIRFIAVALLMLSTLIAATGIERMRFDQEAYWPLFWFQMVQHAFDLLAGLWIWRGRLSTTSMRRLTVACMVTESVTTVVTAWAFGTVSSHMVAFPLLIVLIYRLAFDFRLALAAFALMLVGQWGCVVAETTGWLPAQPLTLDGPDWLYRSAEREYNTMFVHSVVLTLTFVLSNWAVARMRFKEITIRNLREQLGAAAAVRVGRHSGRTLADTYVVEGLLGTGGMGEIYAGAHNRTRRKVAIKLLHAHLADDPQILARFRREAEAIGRLGSEHIVEILDVGADDGQPFLVLELLDGESLGARLVAGPLDLATLDVLVGQLARGLDAAHRAGVVHRDLKPDNVYLCRRDDGSLLVKILDFGVSKIRDQATAITREVALLGTPDYMSPEQAVGLTDEVGERSDLFSLGGIVYAAVTGQQPFIASSMPAQLRRICDEEPVPIEELRPDAPPGLAAVVAIAMAKRPEQRYATARELADDLSAAIAGTLPAEVLARAASVERGRPCTRTTVPRASDAMANAQTQGG